MQDLPNQHKNQEQRAVMAAVMAALDVGARRKIEEVAERIVLLSDGAGQDVIEGISQDIVGDDAKAAFAAIPNQYERALWLYLVGAVLPASQGHSSTVVLLRCVVQLIAGAAATGIRFPQDATRQQIRDVAQGRVGRTLGDRGPLAARELAIETIE